MSIDKKRRASVAQGGDRGTRTRLPPNRVPAQDASAGEEDTDASERGSPLALELQPAARLAGRQLFAV